MNITQKRINLIYPCAQKRKSASHTHITQHKFSYKNSFSLALLFSKSQLNKLTVTDHALKSTYFYLYMYKFFLYRKSIFRALPTAETCKTIQQSIHQCFMCGIERTKKKTFYREIYWIPKCFTQWSTDE